MSFTLRQAAIGFALHLAFTPAALAVMPPYTGSNDAPSAAASSEKQAIDSNAQVMQAVMENRKLLLEVLQRLEAQTQAKRISLKKNFQGE